MARLNYFRIVLTALAATAAAMALVVALAAASASASVPVVKVTDVFPDGGSTVEFFDTNVTASFERDMDASTINDKTFKLKNLSSGKLVPAQVTYDPATKQATLDPDFSLDLRKYKAIIVGGRNGVKAADDGKLGGVSDPSARFKRGKVGWTFEVVCPTGGGPFGTLGDVHPQAGCA